MKTMHPQFFGLQQECVKKAAKAFSPAFGLHFVAI